MRRISVELLAEDYRQLEAFAEALRRDTDPSVQALITVEALASTLLMEGLAAWRRRWYGKQAGVDTMPAHWPRRTPQPQ